MNKRLVLNSTQVSFCSVLAGSLFWVLACSPGVAPTPDARKGIKGTTQFKSGGDGSVGDGVTPTLDTIPTVFVRAGDSFNVNASARDSENNPLRYSLACPAELGGVIENDDGRFSRPVGRNVPTQVARCGVMVRNKYPNKTPPAQYFEVHITGISDSAQVATASSSDSSSDSGSDSKKKKVNAFNPVMVLGAVAGVALGVKLLTGGKGNSKPKTEETYADTWNNTPAGFDGFAFDKQFVDTNFTFSSDADLSKVWGGNSVDAFKYDKLFSGSDFNAINTDAWKDSFSSPVTFDAKNSSWSSSSTTIDYWNTDLDFGTKFDLPKADYGDAFSAPASTYDWNSGFDYKK
jgi:hypothetical protein